VTANIRAEHPNLGDHAFASDVGNSSAADTPRNLVVKGEGIDRPEQNAGGQSNLVRFGDMCG
jgi:hypothetical protein